YPHRSSPGRATGRSKWPCSTASANHRSAGMTDDHQPNPAGTGGKVIWHATMSLDGFLTGPDDAMEWVFEYEGPNAVVDEVIRTTGAILAGRRWHDLAIVRWNGSKGIYGGAWSGPVFVITHRPTEGAHDPAVTFVSDSLNEAVATARAAAK